MTRIDLHCDLLGCVEHNPQKLNFTTPETNCSIPQLLKGGIHLQVLALATLTKKGSTSVVERQVALYDVLLAEFKDQVSSGQDFSLNSSKLHFLFAIENASGLLEDDEPLSKAFARLDAIHEKEPILYVSLTWNHENRFGGGNDSTVGLKEDGRELLEYLDGKGIAIDLSHTSDLLAYDLLNHIDRKGLDVLPIASHSNYREICPALRNLPDPLAKEVIVRGGVIGLNFVRRFVGDSPQDFLRHLEHGLKLGGEDALCLGADFYGGLDLPAGLLPKRTHPTFFEEFGNASCFSRFFSLLEEILSVEQIEKLSYKNAYRVIAQERTRTSTPRGTRT